MNSKQVWVTVIIAIVVAVIVSALMVFLLAPQQPQLAPTRKSFESTKASVLPDLTIGSINAHVGVCGGGPGNQTMNATCGVNMSVFVQNIGESRAGASSTSLRIDSYGSVPGEIVVWNTPSLSSGEGYLHMIDLQLQYGVYNASAMADRNRNITESNEFNNQISYGFWVP